MSDLHRAYLIIGSNIAPEINLSRAVSLLRDYGRIKAVSTVWESRAVGPKAPNYLNVCVLLSTRFSLKELKEKAICSIETTLGRVRSGDKFAPRTIDVDVMRFDNQPLNLEHWNHTYVIIPMAEINPNADHPLLHEKISKTAKRMKQQAWIEAHPELILYKSEG